MLENVQNLTKKYCIHYSIGLVFERCLLDRRYGLQKKAHKLNINLEYSHSLILLTNKFLDNRCKLLVFLFYLGSQFGLSCNQEKLINHHQYDKSCLNRFLINK